MYLTTRVFYNHFVGGYRSSECRTYTWYLFTNSLLLDRKSYSFCDTVVRFWPHLPCTFHEIFRRCYFVYSKVKEDFFYLYGHVHTFDSCRDTIRTAPHGAGRSQA